MKSVVTTKTEKLELPGPVVAWTSHEEFKAGLSKKMITSHFKSTKTGKEVANFNKSSKKNDICFCVIFTATVKTLSLKRKLAVRLFPANFKLSKKINSFLRSYVLKHLATYNVTNI